MFQLSGSVWGPSPSLHDPTCTSIDPGTHVDRTWAGNVRKIGLTIVNLMGMHACVHVRNATINPQRHSSGKTVHVETIADDRDVKEVSPYVQFR